MMAATTGALPLHVLFDLDASIDRQDPREKELQAARDYVVSLQHGRPNNEFHRVLHEKIDTHMPQINGGLLYLILTQPSQSSVQYYNLLELCDTDHFRFVLSKLHNLVADQDLLSMRPFQRLHSRSRERIAWLVRRIADVHFDNLPPILTLLLRQVRSGDLGVDNIALARVIVGILNKHWSRLDPRTDIIPTTVYSILRLISDHQSLPEIQRIEIDYVTCMLRERFRECLRIGRDLFRLLLNVSNIPVFADFLLEMQSDPKRLHPSFEGLTALLATPTNPLYLAQRVTPEMDTKMRYILNKVTRERSHAAIAQYTRRLLKYEEGSASVYADLIRFVCGSVQPPNDVLSSNITQRWEALVNLFTELMAMKNNTALQDAKLALYFDWFFWNPRHDNIMYIEPAMLMMEKMASKSPHIADTLVEYLFFMADGFLPEFSVEIRTSLNLALNSLVEKGVTRSLQKMYSANIAEDTRQRLKGLFPEFVLLADGRRPPYEILLAEFRDLNASNHNGKAETLMNDEFAFMELCATINQEQGESLPPLYLEFFQQLPELRSKLLTLLSQARAVDDTFRRVFLIWVLA
ncbi:protein-domain-containing protein [Gaertneriomyces semiglobifer]|nr:protein-domain-containing protein [Gaertneriomyces semiglobifer]